MTPGFQQYRTHSKTSFPNTASSFATKRWCRPLYGDQSSGTAALSTPHTSLFTCSDNHLTDGRPFNMDRNVSSLYAATEATLTARVCHLAASRTPTAVSRGFGKYLRCRTAKFESPCGVRVQNSVILTPWNVVPLELRRVNKFPTFFF
jgi:hypothetical protein